ncbi:DJ-1/PfpI family protein [Magnetospirillum molischianum]|uniref:Putative amidotransferase of ThiH/PfpI family n=1 Tax=Magnetospirillum molischianum DSM 120 TaxID=1150626 RepID=H8FRU5_MAGML|nr:DJ-1/PfpI family protein [Magnetospirillum molischianum]CCG41083.1 putative amidotransferase of ThiH/PfpI family [Magnetospirillum molischianum DSM 120]
MDAQDNVPAPLVAGFMLFPDQTHLDLAGPWEVLTRLPNCLCLLIAASPMPVESSGCGLTLFPTATYDACPPLDLLCVPGGPGHLAAMEDEALLGFLRRRAPECRYVTSVCTGALVLAAAGLLTGYRATTHWLSLERLTRFGVDAVADQRVVHDRDRVTGSGVTAGIDFALSLTALLRGEDVARRISLQLEYHPEPPFGGGHPSVADPALVAKIRDQSAPYLASMSEIDARVADRLRQG